MSEQPIVADYIVRRLARAGITDCCGVAGDFAFKLCDAVVRSEEIRWIGCSNEPDAAYAADGYARVRGCSMLLTTYADTWSSARSRTIPAGSTTTSPGGTITPFPRLSAAGAGSRQSHHARRARRRTGSSRDRRTGLLHRGRRRPIDGDRTSLCTQLSNHRSATGARRSD